MMLSSECLFEYLTTLKVEGYRNMNADFVKLCNLLCRFSCFVAVIAQFSHDEFKCSYECSILHAYSYTQVTSRCSFQREFVVL
ncbi:hypothetical protein PBPRB1004 [Photobacterium profundum SS9]|uniref:Uncharacterized protein n=1 Tax=Photobacterium profundum (strain SS9) TaxID=298386 RepID=Q6LIK4_PHOPR|nr:hypothetical protein PBPRB1004 [Photobacterium profundum SS9]